MRRRLLLFFVENQCHTEALNMYYSVATARFVYTMSPSLRRYSRNAAKENIGEKIVFALVDRALVSILPLTQTLKPIPSLHLNPTPQHYAME